MTVAAGTRLTLRRARLLDRPRIYEWLTQSDLASNTMGAPFFPERPVPTLDEFSAKYVNAYFDGTRPYAGRMFVIVAGGDEIGCVSHGPIDLLNDVVELDIWLAERRLTSRGLGSEALVLLADWMQTNYGVNRFLVRPSRRNVRALRAMRRAGFRETDLPAAEVIEKLHLPPGDYTDEVLLFRILPVPPATLAPDPARIYVFIDSEFTSLLTPELISIGAVATDSTAFYAEVKGWNQERSTDFVKADRRSAARRRCSAAGDGSRSIFRVARRARRPRTDDDHQRLRLRPLGADGTTRPRRPAERDRLEARADFVRRDG